jgi:PST family polysaccharide transporter
MSKDYIRLGKNFLSLLIVQGGNYLVPLITLPYLVGVLGIESYGEVSYAYAFNMYFIVLSAFGFNLYAPKKIAENSGKANKLNQVVSTVLTVKVLLLICSIPLFIISIFIIPSLNNIIELAFLSFIFVFAQALTPNWFFQGIEKMKVITIASISAKLLYASGLFLFVKEADDLSLVPLLNGLSHLLIAILLLIYTFAVCGVRFSVPSAMWIRYYLQESFGFFLSRISVSFYTISNTFILGTFGSMELTGVFAVADKLFQAMQGAYHPLVNALYPYISRVKDIGIFKKVFFTSVSLNLFAVVLLYFLSPSIFDSLFGEVSPDSLVLFQQLVFAGIIILPSILLGYPFLGAMGYTKFTNMSVIVSSLIHLFILCFLVISQNLSLMNVVIAIFITEILVLSIRVFGTFKYHVWIS